MTVGVKNISGNTLELKELGMSLGANEIRELTPDIISEITGNQAIVNAIINDLIILVKDVDTQTLFSKTQSIELARRTLFNIPPTNVSNLTLGNLLIFDGTNFVNSGPGAGTGVQAYDSDLDDIASLNHDNGAVIKSDGNNWTSGNLNLSELSDTSLSSPSNSQVLRYDGTNWTNQTLPLPQIYNSGGLISNLKAWIGTDTTDANGAWSVDISSASFSNIIAAQVTPQRNSANIGSIPLASIETFSTSLVTGYVVESKLTGVLLGGSIEGLEFAPSGVLVSIVVWGN